jgi:DNA-binding transcriptional LysR family regulator
MYLGIDSMDVKLLTEVARAKNLTRGAEACFMSASAASARIKKIEESLGRQLFIRTPQGLTPTSIGLTVVKHAHAIRHEIERMIAEITFETNDAAGSVTLMANSLSMHVYVPPILENFLIKFPAINVDLHEKTSKDICRMLRSGACDIGIVSYDSEIENLESYPYKIEKLVLVAPYGHPLIKEKRINFSDATKFDFIGLTDASALQSFSNRMMEKNKIKLKTRIQVHAFDTLCSLVDSGVGIGLVPQSVALEYAEKLKISVVELEDHWSIRELKIAIDKKENLSHAAQALLTTFLEDS